MNVRTSDCLICVLSVARRGEVRVNGARFIMVYGGPFGAHYVEVERELQILRL